MKRIFFSAAAVLLTACSSIEYNGEERAPVAAGKDVVLYFSPEQFPKNSKQEILGEAVISAGTNWTMPQLQDKLKKFAAEKGANGLLIDRVEKIPAGKARADQIKNIPAKTWQVDDTSHNAAQYFKDDMTNYSKKADSDQEIYRLSIRAKLVRLSETEQPFQGTDQ